MSASGAWRTIRSTAPTSVSICTELGATTPNSRRAVPFGIVSEPSSETWRSTPPDQPDHLIEAVADEDRRLLVEVGDPEPAGGVDAEHGDAVAARGVPAVGEPPGDEVARAPRATAPATRPCTGSCTSVWPSGSLIGTERTSAPRTFTSASVPAAATPFSRRMRASASHGITFTRRAAAALRRRHRA